MQGVSPEAPKGVFRDAAKRVFDLALVSVGIVLLAPLMLALAAAIVLDSPGGAIYRGLRIGRFGRPFHIFKFRTMVTNADQLGGPSTPDDDPRITRVGRVLRRYKLDELPQLFNVLRGEMSLVGPRPEVPEYVALLTPDERAILTVCPGMTDWASLWDADEGARLAGAEDAERRYLEEIRPQKIRLQLDYVRHRSMGVDVKIIAQTFVMLLRRSIARAPSRSGGSVR